MLIVFNWLVCVDYSLYRSKDHLRLRYRYAAIPVIAVTVLQILRDMANADLISLPVWREISPFIFYSLKLIVEFAYVITAVILVIKYERERREPRFLRITAFIIPFVLGVLIRYYDAPFMTFGVILTYLAMRRRDKYIDFDTGLYTDSYLDIISSHWDKKGLSDANALLLSAPGHNEALAAILSDIKIGDCFIISFGDGRFVILTGALRDSAVLLTKQQLSEAAGEAKTPFEITMQSLRRGSEQSMKDFSAQIRKAFLRSEPSANGGELSI